MGMIVDLRTLVTFAKGSPVTGRNLIRASGDRTPPGILPSPYDQSLRPVFLDPIIL